MARPLGVTIISILVLISAILLIIGGTLLSISGIGLGFISGVGFLFLIPGIIMLVVGIIYIIIFKALRKGKNWARIVLIILGSIAIILNIINGIQALIVGDFLSLIYPIILIILQGIIVGYLLFSKTARRFFS